MSNGIPVIAAVAQDRCSGGTILFGLIRIDYQLQTRGSDPTYSLQAATQDMGGFTPCFVRVFLFRLFSCQHLPQLDGCDYF